MKKLFIILSFLVCFVSAFAQTKYTLPYDTVIVMKPNGVGYLKAGKGIFGDTLFLNKAKLPTGNNGYVWTSDANGNMSLQPASGGGGTPSLPNRSVQLNQNGSFHGTDSMTYNNGALILKHNDSIGNILDYHWSDNPLNTWTDNTSTATVTTDGSTTTISGAGLGINLNNSFVLSRNVGTENYTITGTSVITAKSNTSGGLMINIPPATGMGTGYAAAFLMADTAGYITYDNVTIVPSGANTNKTSYQFVWIVGDTIDYRVQKIRRTLTISMTNRRNGSFSTYTANNIFPQVGQPTIYFYGPNKLVGEFIIRYDEIKRAQISIMGDSIAWGGNASTILGKYFSILLGETGSYGVNETGPGEFSAQGVSRLADAIGDSSSFLIYGYGVNDFSNAVPIATFSNNVQTVVQAAQTAGKTVVILNLVPQSASVVTWNDTLQAIATRYSCPFVDIFSLLKGTGTAMNPLYNSGDNIHPNSLGHSVMARAILDVLRPLLPNTNSPLIIQAPIANNIQLPFLRVDESGKVWQTPNVQDNQYVFNQVPTNLNAQTGGFNVTGNGWVSADFRVGGNGAVATNPDFSVLAGVVHASQFSSQNVTINAGNFTQFDAGFVRLSSGVYFDLLTQPAVFSVRNINSTSSAFEITNLDQGFNTSAAYKWFTIYKQLNSVKDTIMYIDAGGGGHFDSTIVTPNIFTANSDTTEWKPVVVDASGNQRQGFWLGGGGSSAVWGTITGTLSDQTDLQAALDAKWSVTGTSTLTGNTTIDVNTQTLSFPTTNSGFSYRDNQFDVDISDGGSNDIEFRIRPTGAIMSLSSGLTFTGNSTDSSSYAGGSYVQRDWVLDHIANASGSSGANTALSNLASVAINTTLLPGTDATISLGSTSKQFVTTFYSNNGGLNWLNGDASITHASASTIAYQAGDGGHQFYKSGQQSYIQIFNSSITNGWQIETNPIRIRSVAGSTAIQFGSSTDNVGIGGSPDASAKLDVQSTTLGFLPPRMTTTQKNAISSPATGLIVFDTTLGKLCVFSTTWQTITSL